jgi:hypothetical protein
VTPDVTLRVLVQPITFDDSSTVFPAAAAEPGRAADPEEVDFSPWDHKAWREWCSRLTAPPDPAR